jgi:hypothetical protein
MGGPPAAEVSKEESKSRGEDVEVAVREKRTTAQRAAVEITWSMSTVKLYESPLPTVERRMKDGGSVSCRGGTGSRAYAECCHY